MALKLSDSIEKLKSLCLNKLLVKISFVTKNTPNNVAAVGNPWKVIKTMN